MHGSDEDVAEEVGVAAGQLSGLILQVSIRFSYPTAEMPPRLTASSRAVDLLNVPLYSSYCYFSLVGNYLPIKPAGMWLA